MPSACPKAPMPWLMPVSPGTRRTAISIPVICRCQARKRIRCGAKRLRRNVRSEAHAGIPGACGVGPATTETTTKPLGEPRARATSRDAGERVGDAARDPVVRAEGVMKWLDLLLDAVSLEVALPDLVLEVDLVRALLKSDGDGRSQAPERTSIGVRSRQSGHALPCLPRRRVDLGREVLHEGRVLLAHSGSSGAFLGQGVRRGGCRIGAWRNTWRGTARAAGSLVGRVQAFCFRRLRRFL